MKGRGERICKICTLAGIFLHTYIVQCITALTLNMNLNVHDLVMHQ